VKKQEIRDLILQMVGANLLGTGFRLRKRESAFIRGIPGGWQHIGLPLYDYNPVFVFSLNICIRIDAVEDIFNMFSGIESKFQSTTATTMTRLEYFTGGSGEYSVATADDIASAGRVLSGVFRDKIIPFFDENKDAKALDRAVNCTEPGIDSTQPPAGPMHAIILARVAGNPDFDGLVDEIRRRMGLSPEVDHVFNRLVKYLKTR
jgi:hypothetical protein